MSVDLSLYSNLPLVILLSAFATGVSLLLLPENQQKLRNTINLLGALVMISMIGFLISGVYSGGEYETRLPLLPNMDLVLRADALSLLFVSLSGVLWFVTTIYAVGYLKNSAYQSRFFGFFSLCVFATLGIALAGNLITFLIFYELLTLVTYPLVVHKGNAASLRAGKIYLRYTMAGGAVLLAAVVWLESLAGPLNFSATGVLAGMTHLNETELIIIFTLLILGLGVKAAMVPLHGWLPIAMAAPAPVSALLHAVAVVKAGAFGIVRVVYDVYGIEFASALGVTTGLAIAAAITIIYGSLRALFQDDLKKMLAYSTISQVSYIALGTAIAGPLATIGGIVHLVHQGLMKITMFFCAGNFAETLGVHKISDMDGIGRRMPFTMGAFTLAVFGMIGIPPMAGFISKWYLGTGAIEAGAHWVIAVLVISSVLNAMYLLPIVYRAWFKAAAMVSLPGAQLINKSVRRLEAHWMLLLPPIVTVSLATVAGVFAASPYSPLYWVQLIAVREYTYTVSALVMPSLPSLPPLPALDSMMSLWGLVLAPFTLACLLALITNIRALKNLPHYLLPLAALPALYVAMFAGSVSSITPWLFFGSVLQLDTVTQPFLMLAAILWFLAALYAAVYMHNDPRKNAFFVFFLLAMCGSFGLILSQDLFGFITFFTLMSLTSYVMIVHKQTPDARLAGRSYMRWLISGEVLLFTAFCYLFWYNEVNAGQLLTDQWWLGLLLIIGFGIKAGLFGLHFWLPLAHPVAPIPASAVLSGFMVKAGLLGWIKFMPDFASSSMLLSNVLITLGLSGTFFAIAAGLLQKSPKALLAYSTVSQMGILCCVFGISLSAQFAGQSGLHATLMTAIALYAVHHGLAKCALFFSVGLVPMLNGGKAARAIALVLICLPALALVGLPFSSGGIAKSILKSAIYGLPNIVILLSVSAIGTTLLMLRFVDLLKQQAVAQRSEQHPEESAQQQAGMTPLALVCGLTVATVVLLPFSPFVSSEVDFSITSSLSLIWPLALGAAIYLGLGPLAAKFGVFWLVNIGLLVSIFRQWQHSIKGAISTINATNPGASVVVFGRLVANGAANLTGRLVKAGSTLVINQSMLFLALLMLLTVLIFVT
jgi:multicomponent K+:H+ antiporter subunit A